MKAAPLTLNRLEFTQVSIEANDRFTTEEQRYAPQLDFSFSGAMFRKKSSLAYQDEEISEPKKFALKFELALNKEDQKEDICPPYYFRLAAQAFMTLEKSDFDNTLEVFRAVRQTGYSIIYGAMREMVANLTARSTHGMMQLPTAQFQQAAKDEAEKDEANRVVRLKKLSGKAAEELAEDSRSLSSSKNSTGKRRGLRAKTKIAETVKAKESPSKS